MSNFVEAVTSLAKAVWSFTEATLRVLVLVLVILLVWKTVSQERQIQENRLEIAIIKAQRTEEIQAVRDLTTEVRSYRATIMDLNAKLQIMVFQSGSRP